MDKQKRKEIKLAYKEMKPPMGIYQIRNQINQKVWIASTRDLQRAFGRRRFELNMGTSAIKKLQDDWKKHGEENFCFEVLEELKYKDGWTDNDYAKELKKRKEQWIEEIQPYEENGYHSIPWQQR